MHHLLGQEAGSVVKKTVFHMGLSSRRGMKNIAIFNQYFTLSRKRYNI